VGARPAPAAKPNGRRCRHGNAQGSRSRERVQGGRGPARERGLGVFVSALRVSGQGHAVGLGEVVADVMPLALATLAISSTRSAAPVRGRGRLTRHALAAGSVLEVGGRSARWLTALCGAGPIARARPRRCVPAAALVSGGVGGFGTETVAASHSADRSLASRSSLRIPQRRLAPRGRCGNAHA